MRLPQVKDKEQGKQMSLHTPPGDHERQQARLILQTALLASLSTDKQQWLSDQLALVAIERSNRSVDLAFGLCPRRLGKEPVTFSNIQNNALSQCIPGWNVAGLSADAIARILVITCFDDAKQLGQQVTRLIRHADLHEQLAIYKGLPLYPASAVLNDRLADGLRSNMSEVFEAIAHGNPYAAWHLDTHRFSHMVLKALFINSRLSPIVGLEQRNNVELVRMLLDTARERRAASRTVSEELWALTMPFMSPAQKQEFNQEKAA